MKLSKISVYLLILAALAAGALDEIRAQPGGAERWKRQAGLSACDLSGQFPHLRLDEKARVAAGERVDHFRLLFLVAHHILPARQRHRDGVPRSRDGLAKLLSLPDRLLK